LRPAAPRVKVPFENRAGGIGGLLARSVYDGSGGWTNHAYYHADGNGNITYMEDTSESRVATYRYDPFGNLVSSSGSLASANLHRFSSKLFHVQSGMYYYGFRFYDPNLQRWINRDPVGERGGINLYRAVRNAPTRYIDVFGLRPIIVPGAPRGFPQTVCLALAKLGDTTRGKQLLDETAKADVLIAASDKNSGGGKEIEIDRNFSFVPRDDDGTIYPSEAPNSGDLLVGLAIVLGHEIGHALLDMWDPENVSLNENPVRDGLGVPSRTTYHGEPVP